MEKFKQFREMPSASVFSHQFFFPNLTLVLKGTPNNSLLMQFKYVSTQFLYNLVCNG